MIYLLPTKESICVKDGQHQYCIRPPFFSLRNYRTLRERSVIVGFVGARGSGKSVGAARTVIMDYMLHGKTVWSNMEISFYLVQDGKVVLKKSQPLERLSLQELAEVYSNGVIYMDEVNLTAEARRSMSQENLMFSYILQQLRKRRLTIIWSAQSELHCDDRLRFQTDIFIMCEDVSKSKTTCGIGELSLWKAHDYSGVVKGHTPNGSDDAIFYQGVQWNKPWWNTYNSWEIQDIEVDTKKDKLDAEARRIAADIAAYMRDSKPVIAKREVWKRWRITDYAMMSRIAMCLSAEYGVISKGRKDKFILEDEMEEIGA